MTTRHSSSQLASRAAPVTLLDSISRPITLAKEIGRGGEGSVYEVDGLPTQLAKVYHKRPLPEDQVAKLNALVACWSSELELIAAWPRTLLFDPVSRKPCGLLMTKMEGARPLHELYGTTNRRRHFPDVGWHHLVLAARNTAAAFHTVHSAGVIVGDVNQGNLLVDKLMCVRMIDCDSFQITRGDRTFSCPVGTPHFTPPELQSQKLRLVTRTENHDRFGLAVLIFHLLFVGRHPFAGRFHGPGDLSIEKAIAERRFAFSRSRAETLVDPPPASLLLEDLPAALGNLFDLAFRGDPSPNPSPGRGGDRGGDGDGSPRPTPLDWVQQLEALMKRRKTCRFDSMHVYPLDLDECPWCRIEDAGGPAFFVPAGGITAISADRLAVLNEKILLLEEVSFPDLAPRQTALPTMPPLRPPKERRRIQSPDITVGLLVASWAICLLGAVFGSTIGVPSMVVLGAGSLLSLLFAGALTLGKKARARRNTADQFRLKLKSAETALWQRGQRIQTQHAQREAAFRRSTDDWRTEIENYRTADTNLENVLVRHRESQKADFLRGYLIRDYYRKIPNLTPSQVIMLESFGVESANDVERIRLYGVPGVDPEMVMELLGWRMEVERGFEFNPEHGVTLKEANASKEAAVRRFKLSQARKILTGAKQLQALTDADRADLSRALGIFNREADQWRDMARELREFEASRLPLERKINQSPALIVALALGVPFVAFVLYLLVG